MKLLMRADTHVSFSVPYEEPKAKCTTSQVFSFPQKSSHQLTLNCFELGPGSFDRVLGLHGGGILIRLHLASLSFDAGPQHHQLWYLRSRSKWKIFPNRFSSCELWLFQVVVARAKKLKSNSLCLSNLSPNYFYRNFNAILL